MKQFPIVRISGTHYEVGRAVGEVMRGSIVTLFEKNRSLHPYYFVRHKDGANALIGLTQSYFSQYIEELRGMADGAGLPMEELFLSNTRELGYFESSADADHCTVIAVPSDDGYLVGHNEDWEADALDHLYILDATIEGVKIFGLGYDFVNTIIGDSVAINQFGLVEAVNELSHTDTHIGVPKAFIARAVIDCKTLEETEEIIKTIPRRSGFNHFLVQEKRLLNMETSAKEYAVEKMESTKYLHTNHYVTNLKRIDKGNAISEARFAKVQKLLPTANSVEDMKRALSDTHEPKVCRDETIGSVIFDIPKKQALVAYGQPTQDSYVEYSLDHVLN